MIGGAPGPTCHAHPTERPRSGWLLDGRRSGRNAPSSAFRFDADAIIDGAANALLAAQIPLGGLNGNVPEKKLNLRRVHPRRRLAAKRAGAALWPVFEQRVCGPLIRCCRAVRGKHQFSPQKMASQCAIPSWFCPRRTSDVSRSEHSPNPLIEFLSKTPLAGC